MAGPDDAKPDDDIHLGRPHEGHDRGRERDKGEGRNRGHAALREQAQKLDIERAVAGARGDEFFAHMPPVGGQSRATRESSRILPAVRFDHIFERFTHKARCWAGCRLGLVPSMTGKA